MSVEMREIDIHQNATFRLQIIQLSTPTGTEIGEITLKLLTRNPLNLSKVVGFVSTASGKLKLLTRNPLNLTKVVGFVLALAKKYTTFYS